MHNAIAVGILMLVTSLSFLLALVLEWGCLALMFRVLHGRFPMTRRRVLGARLRVPRRSSGHEFLTASPSPSHR